MKTTEQEYRNEIKQALVMHGRLALLFYQIDDEYIIKKWGSRESLEDQHKKLFDKYMNAGLIDEAESLTLMDLPQDENMIYRILHCGTLKNTLEEYGILEHLKQIQ